MKKLLLALSLLFSQAAFGIVDMRSAGYSKTFVDFKMELKGYPLKIERTYNSRSLYNGLFGFGWCSNLETRLSVLPDGSIKVVECGGGMEVLYYPKGKKPDTNLIVSSILNKLKARKMQVSEKYFNKLKKDLLQSRHLRAEFIDALDLKGSAESGVRYYAQGRFNEYVFVTSSGHTRQLPSGVREKFDKEGRLVKSSDGEGHIDIMWKDKSLQVMNERGQRLSLYLSQKGGKISSAKFKGKTIAQYTYSGEDLAKALNSYGEVFKHEYDNFHNLTKNIYPDGSSEALTYNVTKDWVIGFKDRKNCKEKYDFGVNNKNPDHYFSLVKKTCGRKIVNESKYEFWHKRSSAGGKYLHRARAVINGRLKTDVIYHPVFRTPVSYLKDGVRTSRKFYKNGFLKERDNKFQNVKYSNYNKKCRKPEKVIVGYKSLASKDKGRLVRKEAVSFNYNVDCHLSMAKKSNDEWIKIEQDSRGRIISMEDQSRKKITLAWHKEFNKPERITRVGVGSIKIVFDKKGSVVDFKSLKSGATVITQVTSVFNSFLSTLAPVAGEMVIL